MTAPASPPAARKYSFDTEFAADGTILRDPFDKERTRLTLVEAEDVKAQAYQSGTQDAVAQAERASAEAAAELARLAQLILGRLDAEQKRLRADAMAVALAAAKKIAGAALDQFGEERAVAAVEAAMEALPAGPRLIIRVAPGLMESMKRRLDAAAASHAYQGAILLRTDEHAQIGDVTVDWTEGVATIERRDIEARVAALIEAALTAPSGETEGLGDERT